MLNQFLGLVCNILNLQSPGWFCTHHVIYICLNLFDMVIELSPTYRTLKPHMKLLFYKVSFFTVCLTPENIYLFESDPHDFIHHHNYLLVNF